MSSLVCYINIVYISPDCKETVFYVIVKKKYPICILTYFLSHFDIFTINSLLFLYYTNLPADAFYIKNKNKYLRRLKAYVDISTF